VTTSKRALITGITGQDGSYLAELLLEINAKVVNAFTGPLFGIFLLAMFSRRASSAAVLAAGVMGAVMAYYVAYHSNIGFMWPSTFGLAATLLVGVALALVMPMRADDERRALTWRAVMARSTAERPNLS